MDPILINPRVQEKPQTAPESVVSTPTSTMYGTAYDNRWMIAGIVLIILIIVIVAWLVKRSDSKEEQRPAPVEQKKKKEEQPPPVQAPPAPSPPPPPVAPQQPEPQPQQPEQPAAVETPTESKAGLMQILNEITAEKPAPAAAQMSKTEDDILALMETMDNAPVVEQTDTQCCATTLAGTRCTKPVKTNGKCAVHC